MTVSSTTRKAGPFIGNGLSVAFPFSFKVFDGSDLLVVLVDAFGNATDLVFNSDYTVLLNPDQNANPGGVVTYPRAASGVSPLPSTSTLTMLGNMPETQTLDITEAGGFYPSDLNDALDRQTILTQQLDERVSRALTFPVQATGLSPSIPTPIPGDVIGWSPDGLSLVNIDPGAAAGASAAAAAASAATAAAAATSSAAGAATSIQAAQALNFANTQLATGIAVFNSFDMGFVTDVPAGSSIDLGAVP